ncbi:hypothetical protein T439DRAFT_309621 [Meredithblackwellia eburnea MCA 4105]
MPLSSDPSPLHSSPQHFPDLSDNQISSAAYLVTEHGNILVAEGDLDVAATDEVILDGGEEEDQLFATGTVLPSDDLDDCGFEGDEIWDEYGDVMEASDRWILAQPQEDLTSPSKHADEDQTYDQGLDDPRWVALTAEVDKEGPPVFFKAGGSRLVISEEAMKRARMVVEGNDEDSANTSDQSRPEPAPFNRPRPLRPNTTTAGTTAGVASFTSPRHVSTLSTFRDFPINSRTDQHNLRIAPPDSIAPTSPFPTLDIGVSGGPSNQFVGFATGSGARLSGPSGASLARAAALLTSPGDSPRQLETSSLELDAARFNTYPRNNVPLNSPATSDSSHRRPDGDVFAVSPRGASLRVGDFHLDQAPKRSTATNSTSHIDSPTTSRLLPRAPLSPTKPQSTPKTEGLPKTVGRTPSFVGPRPATSKGPVGSTSTPSLKRFHSPLLKSQQRPSGSSVRIPSSLVPSATPTRRVNIGVTPRRGLAQPKFITPFKNGVRPSGLGPTGLPQPASKPTVLSPSVGSSISTASKDKGRGKLSEIPKSEQSPSALKLNPPASRLSLKEAGFRPQTHYFEHLIAANIPKAALTMDAQAGRTFNFDDGRGINEALAGLIDSGCSLVSLAWVKNHWALILWKLASYVRTRPDTLSTYWNFDATLNQLKYRYEKEVNNAQRSCIKRIQEQDSSPAHPMVLCVTQIRWDTSQEESAGANTAEIVGLELTDGWYRIRSNVDLTLRGACKRGKLVVGSKVVITGAKIDSSRDGTDVLEALSRSTLVISGNSTTLAPWDAKLGWAPYRFTVTLDSLTCTGGPAPLIDIVLEKVFPCGYTEFGKNSQYGTWCWEEEKVKAYEWEAGREKARAKLLDMLEKHKGEWEEIIEHLQEAACRCGPPPSTASDPDSNEEQPDEILDRLEDADDKAAIISKLSPRQVSGTLQLAVEQHHLEQASALTELEKDLKEAFPPRNVRAFRVVRIRDWQASQAGRTALLTIWDADTFDSNFLIEGQRYQVTQTIPKGTWKRSTTEIGLATRRESKWIQLE